MDSPQKIEIGQVGELFFLGFSAVQTYIPCEIYRNYVKQPPQKNRKVFPGWYRWWWFFMVFPYFQVSSGFQVFGGSCTVSWRGYSISKKAMWNSNGRSTATATRLCYNYVHIINVDTTLPTTMLSLLPVLKFCFRSLPFRCANVPLCLCILFVVNYTRTQLEEAGRSPNSCSRFHFSNLSRTLIIPSQH